MMDDPVITCSSVDRFGDVKLTLKAGDYEHTIETRPTRRKLEKARTKLIDSYRAVRFATRSVDGAY